MKSDFCMDKIIISELQLLCKIGVEPDERVRAQPLLLTLELTKDLQPAGITDDVEKTIDYSSVCKEIKNVATKEFRTIEGLAEAISTQIKSLFNPDNIKVIVEKPCALLKHNAKSAGVVIER